LINESRHKIAEEDSPGILEPELTVSGLACQGTSDRDLAEGESSLPRGQPLGVVNSAELREHSFFLINEEAVLTNPMFNFWSSVDLQVWGSRNPAPYYYASLPTHPLPLEHICHFYETKYLSNHHVATSIGVLAVKVVHMAFWHGDSWRLRLVQLYA